MCFLFILSKLHYFQTLIKLLLNIKKITTIQNTLNDNKYLSIVIFWVYKDVLFTTLNIQMLHVYWHQWHSVVNELLFSFSTHLILRKRMVQNKFKMIIGRELMFYYILKSIDLVVSTIDVFSSKPNSAEKHLHILTNHSFSL